jgi:hypothetical protein
MAGLLADTDFDPQHSSATQIPVVSPREAQLQAQTGSQANGQVAPPAVMVDTQQQGAPAMPKRSPGLLDASDLGSPPQPQDTGDDFEAAMGESSPKTLRESGIILKGMLKGGASTVTAPVDLANAIKSHAYNWVRQQFGLEEDKDKPTNYGDLVNNGLTAAGFPQAKGLQENALETTAGVAGGALAGQAIPNLAGPAKLSYNRLAGPTGGVNQEVVNTLAARKIGEEAANLTPQVKDAAGARIRAALDTARDENKIVMNHPDAVNSHLGAIAGEHTPADGALLNNNFVRRLSDAFSDGAANNEQLGDIASGLGREAANKASTDWAQAQGLFKVKDYVESMISEGLTGPEKQAYDTAREQYKWLARFQEPGMVTLDKGGNVNAVKLATLLEKEDTNAFVGGGSGGINTEPLYQVLRQVQGSDGTSMPAIYHNKIAMIARAAARLGPGAAQYVVQKGLLPGLRAVVNQPGFIDGLGQELAGHANEGEDNGSNQ